MGRPTKYTKSLANLICQRMIEGESLRKICSDEAMPDKANVFRWLAVKEDFRDQYARARDIQAELIVDEIFELADDKTGDLLDGEFGAIGNGAAVQRSKLQVDARKWYVSKILPKKYGDKVGLEHSGKVDLVGSLKGLSDEELIAIAAKLGGTSNLAVGDPEGTGDSEEESGAL